jgi:predicted amidohydrolase/GNAT superfamily N-acetyltransferase
VSLNLEDFETKIRIRPITIDDFERLVEIQQACFPGMAPWKREQIESQLRLFPGGQACVEIEGQVVASSSSLMVDSSEHTDWHNWKAIADDGYIRTHDPDGDTLYGIELMVHPKWQGLRLSRRLYDERKRVCREHNLERMIIGGRIPGYQQHAEAISAREYVEAVMRKSYHDPVLTAQVANGFTLKRLIPGYMPSDAQSCGYATFLEWANIDYAPARRRRYRAVRPVRLCVVQYQLRPIDSFEEFAQQCEFFTDVAAEHRADFVVFPELFTTQLLSCMEEERRRPGEAVRALAELTPRYLELFGQLAIKHNANIVGGSLFVVEEDRLYNASYLFRRDGSMERQLKLHITQSERKWWGLQGGPELAVFSTDRCKVAILISQDVEFPEVSRIAASKGAEILFVPFSADERTAFLRLRTCALARAIENDVYVATAGCVGNLPFVEHVDTHYAQSGVYTPVAFSFPRDGVAEECDANIETLIVCDVDLEHIRRNRAGRDSLDWSERRDDLYEVRYREGGQETTV